MARLYSHRTVRPCGAWWFFFGECCRWYFFGDRCFGEERRIGGLPSAPGEGARLFRGHTLLGGQGSPSHRRSSGDSFRGGAFSGTRTLSGTRISISPCPLCANFLLPPLGKLGPREYSKGRACFLPANSVTPSYSSLFFGLVVLNRVRDTIHLLISSDARSNS